MTSGNGPDNEITWEVSIPLVTNPRMIATFGIVVALSVLIPVLIMGLIFGSRGEWSQIVDMAKLFGLVGAVLFVMVLLIMVVFFRNRIRTRYTVNDKGILQETIDNASRIASRLAVVGGSLARNPGAAGAGLTAMSQESEALEWNGGFVLDARPARHMLILRNAWRPVMIVYCIPENYAQVEVLVRHYIARNRTTERIEAFSPIPGCLARTALVLLSCFPVFAASHEFDLDIFLPTIMLAFALATLWLIPLFGYVVLLANALILITFLGYLLEEQTSYFQPGEIYLRYERFSENDWGNLALALTGLVYLSWLSWRAVRGKLVSLLIRDRSSMG